MNVYGFRGGTATRDVDHVLGVPYERAHGAARPVDLGLQRVPSDEVMVELDPVGPAELDG